MREIAVFPICSYSLSIKVSGNLISSSLTFYKLGGSGKSSSEELLFISKRYGEGWLVLLT